jgi:hypothetical protein
MVDQFVDPTVSRTKFDAEMAQFLYLRQEYEGRGWFLVDAAFPLVFVVLVAPKIDPPAIAYGVIFDYSNYDSRPPSVIFVNPFTREPRLYKEFPPHMRLNRSTPGVPQFPAPGMLGNIQISLPQALLQAFDEEEVPFLCIPGVLEYHEHPAHIGDSWELHRTAGAGRLVRLLDVITQYGVDPIRGYTVNLVPQVGLDVGPPPP